MTALVGAAKPNARLLTATDYRDDPASALDNMFRVDYLDLRRNWPPQSMLLGVDSDGIGSWIEAVWWELPEQVSSGANYDPFPEGVLMAADQRLLPAWSRDDLFRLDDDNLRKGWAPRTMLVGADNPLIEGVWWEETELGFHGPNNAPNAETLHGAEFSRTQTAAAALAIYDTV